MKGVYFSGWAVDCSQLRRSGLKYPGKKGWGGGSPVLASCARPTEVCTKVLSCILDTASKYSKNPISPPCCKERCSQQTDHDLEIRDGLDGLDDLHDVLLHRTYHDLP